MAKIVDIHAYLPVLIDLIGRGESVTVTVTGSSMTPFLVHGRDQIRFRRPDGPLRRGDLAFFRRDTGSYVMHRVARVDAQGRCYLVGDGQQAVEGPIRPDQIFGLVTEVCRKGRWIGPEDRCWRFFAGPWLTLRPLRPLLRGAYGRVARHRTKRGEPSG